MSWLQALPGSWLAVALAAPAGALLGGWISKWAYRVPLRMEQAWAEQCREWLGQQRQAQPELSLPNAALASPHIHPFGSSVCPHCTVRLPLRQQVPLLSWFVLGRRCAFCRAAIPARYPLTELACASLFGLCAAVFGTGLAGLVLMAWLATLLLLACIDLRASLLPDSLTLPLLWAGLLFNASGDGLTGLHDAVLGAVGGYLVLWLIFHGFRLLTGREGMGYGDFKLLAALGAWLGLSALPMLLLGASIAGVLVGLTLIWSGKAARGQPQPFGPFLVLAGILTLFVRGLAQLGYG